MNIGKVLCDSVLFCLELYHLNQKEERNRQFLIIASVMQMSSVDSIHPTSESIVIYSIKQILMTYSLSTVLYNVILINRDHQRLLLVLSN